MARRIAILNQLVYLSTIMAFYYINVHMPINQVQLDSSLIDMRIADHQLVYADSNIMAIVYDDPSIENALGSFAQKLKNFMKLDDIRFVHRRTFNQSEYEYVIHTTKATENELKISDDSLNRVTVLYTSMHELSQIINIDTFAYFLWISDRSHITYAKGYHTIYYKLHYLVKDQHSKTLNRHAVRSVRYHDTLKYDLDKAIKSVVGQNVQIKHLSNYNVKNTFGVYVNSITPNADILKTHFQSIIERYDEELVESVPTMALNIVVDVNDRPLSDSSRLRYHAYRNCLYLRTTAASIADDLLRASKYLLVKNFGLDTMSDEFRKIFGREEYGKVLKLANMFRERRILKTSLVFLRSLKYINENRRFAIKKQHLQNIQDALENYHTTLSNKDYPVLLALSNYNEHNYFDTTYMYEQYIYGLLTLIVIACVSPMFKLLKDEILNRLLYCRRRDRASIDFSVLSLVSFMFETSVVACHPECVDDCVAESKRLTDSRN